MAATRAVRLAALSFLAGAALAGADTAVGPTANIEAGLPAPGDPIAGAFYAGDYGPLYVRVSGDYLPMPPRPGSSLDWPPPSTDDDRGYASCEALGAFFPGEPAAIGWGLYYNFGRGVRDYYYHKVSHVIESETEDYVAFKHDFLAVAAARRGAGEKGTAVFWGGLGLSHFRRHGLRYYYSSDYYNPENTYEVFTPLDTELTALSAGAGADFRVVFAGPFGFYGSARGVVRLANIHLEGYDRGSPDANLSFTGGGLVGW